MARKKLTKRYKALQHCIADCVLHGYSRHYDMGSQGMVMAKGHDIDNLLDNLLDTDSIFITYSVYNE